MNAIARFFGFLWSVVVWLLAHIVGVLLAVLVVGMVYILFFKPEPIPTQIVLTEAQATQVAEATIAAGGPTPSPTPTPTPAPVVASATQAPTATPGVAFTEIVVVRTTRQTTVRKDASALAAVIATVPSGTDLYAVGANADRRPDWIQVSNGSWTGWVKTTELVMVTKGFEFSNLPVTGAEW